jgi:hypothetical protein
MSAPRLRLETIHTLEHLSEHPLDARQRIRGVAHRDRRLGVGLYGPLPSGDPGGVELTPASTAAAAGWGWGRGDRRGMSPPLQHGGR